MATKVFFSFHYTLDNWRASQIRNIGAIEGNQPIKDNEWEEVKKGGEAAIERWIDAQMAGKSCTIVLVGAETANRKFVRYEIKKSWEGRKGLLGIRIHKLLDSQRRPTYAGSNPFAEFSVGYVSMSSLVQLYDPPQADSSDVYAHIAANIATWVERAIADAKRR